MVSLSTPSRVIGIILMYSGTVLFIGFTSLFAAYWVRETMEKEIIPLGKEVKKEEKETRQIEKEISEINKKLDYLLKNKS